MGDDVACENDAHEITCIGQCHFACTEEGQDGIDECQKHNAQRDAERDVHDEHVAQNLLRRCVVALPQFYAHQCGGTNANHGSEGCSE